MTDAVPVDVTTLPPADLNRLRQSLAADIELITASFGNLKVAQSRYAQAGQAVDDFMNEEAGDREIMVPLTGSLYVPGKLKSNDLLVDIGTGYFVQKTLPQSRKFINGKLKMLNENLEKVGASLQLKRRDLEMVTLVLQQRMQEVQQRQTEQIAKVEQMAS